MTKPAKLLQIRLLNYRLHLELKVMTKRKDLSVPWEKDIPTM